MPIIFRGGTIFFPPSNDAPLFRVRITRINGDVYTIADSENNLNEILGLRARRISKSLTMYQITLLSENRKYVSPTARGCLFEEGDIIDIFATYSSSIVENSHHVLRVFVDNAYMSMSEVGPSVEIEGRDYPIIASDEGVIRSFDTTNVIDCFIDRTNATGTIDSEGNYQNGLLYDTGLVLQVYDHISANDWVTVKDLSDSDFNTLKSNFTVDVTDDYENKKHITIASSLLDSTKDSLGDSGYYVHYDYANSVWYFRIYLEGEVKNETDHVVINQNWLTGPSRFGVNNDDVVKDAIVYGKTVSGLPLIRRSYDSTYSGARAKRKVYQDSTLDTMNLVQNRADTIIATSKDAPLISDAISCLALLSLKPGESIKFSNPEIGMDGWFVVPEYELLITANGEFDTLLQVKKHADTIGRIQKEQINSELATRVFSNIAGMNQSVFFDFRTGEEEVFYTLDGMTIDNQTLKLSDVDTAGGLTTKTNNLLRFNQDIQKVLVRMDGSDLDNTTIRVSADGGVNPQNAPLGSVVDITNTGKNFWMDIDVENVNGISPEIKTISITIYVA